MGLVAASRTSPVVMDTPVSPMDLVIHPAKKLLADWLSQKKKQRLHYEAIADSISESAS